MVKYQKCDSCKKESPRLTAQWKKNKFVYFCQACLNGKDKRKGPNLIGETTSKN